MNKIELKIFLALIFCFNANAQDLKMYDNTNNYCCAIPHANTSPQIEISCGVISIKTTTTVAEAIKNDATSLCPKVVIDNYEYPLFSTIKMYTKSNYVSISSLTMSNCLNGLGNPPTFNTSNNYLIAGSSIIGINDMHINESDWAFVINSLDGDIACNGGTPYVEPQIIDEIFINGFEKDLIFQNSFD